MTNLLQSPAWRPEQLGQPLPASTHGVSVALPRWSDVVGYEEKSPKVMARLSSGYPRFLIHPRVLELGRLLSKQGFCLPLPSASVADQCAAFVAKTPGAQTQVVSRNGTYGVATNEAGAAVLKAFWQHTGLIVSSRQAEALLNGRAGRDPRAAGDARRTLRKQLAGFYHCAEEDVFLAPTGMAAVFAALRAANELTPNRRSVQLGFPYVDTLKLQQKFGPGGILLHNTQTMGSDLEELLSRESLAACFCEIPGNPLLGSPDLPRISKILRPRQVPLIVDDVVATPYNIDLSPYADLIPTSLTKFISGTGDVMGGALICNRESPLYSRLKPIIEAQHEELLWQEDADVLEVAARDFPERMKRHNANGLYIAERMRVHPAIERVWYPKWECSKAYDAVRRPQGGWGALLSFVPKNAATTAPKIYDRLELCKGPSLGTVFTLACPFTLLAHYTELDWAESCGVSRWLIRLSVGLEEPEAICKKLATALEES
ncbi:MAG: hypothetical protein C5B50_03515 [Verrucomicrobia bacterium]|nr:MAG: hypothetical protein C5B50_03515 [Verrucomicrobiota bacterium]